MSEPILWVGYGRIQQSHPAGAWSENDDIAIAWHELSVSMEAAGAELMAIAGTRDKEEGFQALSSLLSKLTEMKLTKGDPLRPAFTDWMSNHRRFLGDSPDAIYLTAEISGNLDYEITGNKADVHYLGIMLYDRTNIGIVRREHINMTFVLMIKVIFDLS